MSNRTKLTLRPLDPEAPGGAKMVLQIYEAANKGTELAAMVALTDILSQHIETNDGTTAIEAIGQLSLVEYRELLHEFLEPAKKSMKKRRGISRKFKRRRK